MDFQQDMQQKCSPEGRDCIKKHSTETFNCSTTCEGIYADVQCTEEREPDEIKTLKITKLIAQYEKYKKQKVQHFVFDASANLTAFGKLSELKM